MFPTKRFVGNGDRRSSLEHPKRVTHAEDHRRCPGFHGMASCKRPASRPRIRPSIFTVPVVLGGGNKLFADGSAPHSFKLTSSRVSPNGLIVGHYERGGEIKVGDTDVDSPKEREVARRERMKRENQKFGDAVDPMSTPSPRWRDEGTAGIFKVLADYEAVTRVSCSTAARSGSSGHTRPAGPGARAGRSACRSSRCGAG